MHNNVSVTRRIFRKIGRLHWNSRRYVINNNPVPRTAEPTANFGGQVAGVRTTIGPHYNLLFDALPAGGDPESVSGEIFEVMGARRDVRIIRMSSACHDRAGDRRALRFDDAKSIPRTSLSGLNDVARCAARISFVESRVVSQLT